MSSLPVTCKNSAVLYLCNIGYVRLYNLKFKRCQFAIQRVDYFLLVNVKITDLTVRSTFAIALQLLRTNLNIIGSIFSRIAADYGTAGGIIAVNQQHDHPNKHV